MIQETTTHVCRVCKSTHIVKNGTNRCGNAQYHCKDCGAYRVLKPTQVYSETEQQLVLRACLERCSLRGIARIFAMARQTIARWFREHTQKLPDVKETLLPATPNDVLELDEIWSFVQKKEQTRWVWTAMCRRTRQIVAFAIGDRSKATCLRLWQAIPHEYKHCHTFSDFWPVYQYVFPDETHHCVGKETGETAHMERWNNTLRQRIGRYVRQTLSFSRVRRVSSSHHSGVYRSVQFEPITYQLTTTRNSSLPTGISRVCTGSSNNLDIVRYTPFLPLKRRTTSLRNSWD